MFNKLKSIFNVLVCSVLIFQFAGCGTILYPERKGQKAGRIDVGVALLDAVGLLFFFLPGIIAFAVDFNNGTIYLPGTSRGSLDIDNLKQVKFDPKNTSVESIEEMILEQTGLSVKLDQSNMQRIQLESTKDMVVRFEQILPTINDDRMVSIR